MPGVKTIALIEARRGATGQPLQRRLGGHGILEWVVRRVTECQRLDGVVVVAGAGLTAHDVRTQVPPGIAVHGEPQQTLIERYLEVAERYQAAHLVRVASDQPLVDPVSIDRLVTTAAEMPRCDYMSFQAGEAVPCGASPLGLFAEWFRVESLCRAAQQADPSAEHVTSCLYEHPEQYHLRLIPLPQEMEHFGLKLVLDDDEAWEHAQVLYDCLGPDQFQWHRIANLLGMTASGANLAPTGT